MYLYEFAEVAVGPRKYVRPVQIKSGDVRYLLALSPDSSSKYYRLIPKVSTCPLK